MSETTPPGGQVPEPKAPKDGETETFETAEAVRSEHPSSHPSIYTVNGNFFFWGGASTYL